MSVSDVGISRRTTLYGDYRKYRLVRFIGPIRSSSAVTRAICTFYNITQLIAQFQQIINRPHPFPLAVTACCMGGIANGDGKSVYKYTTTFITSDYGICIRRVARSLFSCFPRCMTPWNCLTRKIQNYELRNQFMIRQV